MKKIMFNDQYGLTKAVLEGKKTMTRLFSKTYEVGEVVAIAQSYSVLIDLGLIPIRQIDFCKGSAGYINKMYVKASLMPHHILITDLKKERLQEISDEDCLCEGILEDFEGVQYSFPCDSFCWQYPFNSPRAAFAALIDKVCGKGTWDSDPFVYAYSFDFF